MIRVQTGGRMGNQMFQLAFAHAASRRLDTAYILGRPPFWRKTDLGAPLWEHFEVGSYRHAAVRFTRRARFVARYGPRAELVVVEQDDDPDAVLAGVQSGKVYTGFYQSERWFAGAEDEVERMFTVRPRYRAEFERRYPAAERKPYVCMHVRRKDYLETKLWALPTAYFRDALDAVGDLAGYEVIVVSDDPAWVREEFRDVPGLVVPENPPMVDFQLLTHADVVIASNSSFSWWGAWLNRRPGLRVFAPQHWLGFVKAEEEPVGVVPDRWTQIPVRGGPLVAPEA